MSGPVVTDLGCKFFRELPETTLKRKTIHRFIAGQDTAIQELTLAEAKAKAELGDVFATEFLLKGVFPKTSGEVLARLKKVGGAGDPLRTHRFFFLGEGSQVPPDTTGVQRNLRFLAVTGKSEGGGPDLMISTFHPDRGDLELMAWDRKRGGFNYYRTVGDTTGWIFAGNSRHAVEPKTEGNGPFQTHTSGNFIMKELKAPWINWDSPDASISPKVLPAAFRDHPWFRQRESGGALTCELEVARPSITRWTKARFEQLLPGGNGTIERPRRIMEQILGTPTVNLVSSFTEGTQVARAESVDLPATFFVDEALSNPMIGLEGPPGFAVPGKVYAQALKTFKVRWTDGGNFTRPGDTHFAFVVPERAFEDIEVLRRALKTGLIGERFAASLLMVDFPNPVYSARRAKLLDHVPAKAIVEAGKSTFGQEMAKNILAAAEASPANSPEREFAERWGAGAGWKAAFNKTLAGYYRALGRTLKAQGGFDRIFRVAESRRNRMRAETPLVESPLLFATTNVARSARASLRPDGTVV